MAKPTKKEELARLREIAKVLKKYEGDFIMEKLKLKHLIPGIKSKGTPKKFYQPKRVRSIFEELGGSFVKLGQLLSLRPDILPKEYITELTHLQDDVKPLQFAKVKKVVEKDLGKPICDLFKSFDKEPLSSASVSQVHRAVLKDGRSVVVKVQRPGLKKLFAEDIGILKFLANLAEEHLDIEIFSPVEFVEEFEEYTHRELDFLKEAKNIEKFSTLFGDDSNTIVPEVEWDLTTEKVITMTYIEGIHIKNRDELEKANLDSKEVATNLAHSIYSQMFIWGMFHADPHPGNVLALEGNRIALLDYGIVGRFTPSMQRHLKQIFIAMLEKDIDQIADGLLMLHILTPESDPEKFKRDLLENLGQFYDTSLEHIKLSDFVLEMLAVMRENRMEVPRDFILLGKALLTLEGTCHVLEPEFNPVTAGRSFMKILLKRERNPKYLMRSIVRETTRLKNFIINLPEQTREVVDVLRKADDYIASINKTMKVLTLEMDRISSRVTKGILVAAFILAGSFMVDLEVKHYFGISLPSVVCFAIAALLGLELIISSLRQQRFVKKIFNERFFRRLFKRR